MEGAAISTRIVTAQRFDAQLFCLLFLILIVVVVQDWVRVVVFLVSFSSRENRSFLKW